MQELWFESSIIWSVYLLYRNIGIYWYVILIGGNNYQVYNDGIIIG